MTHRELVDLSHKFVLKNMACGFAVKELKTTCKEIVDVLGFGAWNHSILLEIKTSFADFKRDAKKSFRINPAEGVGKYRFYVCPKNLIQVEDLPDNWGLIWEENAKLEIVFNPYCRNPKGSIFNGGFKEYNKDAERAIMYSALRRQKATKN